MLFRVATDCGVMVVVEENGREIFNSVAICLCVRPTGNRNLINVAKKHKPNSFETKRMEDE